jgi:hypothetical protein
MARQVTHEISWKPRSQRKLEAQTGSSDAQLILPFPVGGVFAGDESGVSAVAPEAVEPPKKSKFAVLLWEPRS